MFDFMSKENFGFYDDDKSEEENRETKNKMSHNRETFSFITTMAGCATAVMVMGLTVKRVYDAFNE